jgi:DNA excision repair protein ERCC-2
VSYTVAVRELCEFTAKRGDLDLRFTPTPTAQEGIAGHATVAGRRGKAYQREVPLQCQYKTLTLRGRADGYHAEANELEEVKTYRGDLRRMPDNHRALHWAQLKIYGAMLCAEKVLSEIRLTLVYFDIDREEETPLSERHSAQDLQAFLEEHCERFLAWAEQQAAHKAVRDEALAAMAFPHAEFHAGQRTLAEAVYRAAKHRHDVLIQAPTGIGKSVGTVFPALKAMAQQHLDRVFFLTAKTPGRQLGLDAVSSLRKGANDGVLPLRALELVARDKCCEHPDKACHGDACPLARGFYDRLPAARRAAVSLPQLDQAAVRELARGYEVCPYYLSQDLARWADVVVGDYNYFFDQSALLHGLTVVNDWRVGVLVDEAHNLVERGRGMYSAELDQRQLLAVKKTAPPQIRKVLDQVHRAWNRAVRDQEAPYCTYPTPPLVLADALHKATTVLGKHFADNGPEVLTALQQFYFDAMNFLGRCEEFGEHSICDVQLLEPQRAQPALSILCIRNVVPAMFLARRLETATATIAFSATLNPPAYYQDMLGFAPSVRWIDVPSPFSSEQLAVTVVDRISTRYQRRAASLAPIAELIAEQYRRTPGNYLAFFSSFDYLQKVADQLADTCADVPIWRQGPRMSEIDRAGFLERFVPGGQGVGFAVLGGAFAEGIDLPGSRLIGAFIATLGLPQVNPVNEEMRLRMEQLFGAGYDYTYLYPGIRKVVQAAGRVIRSREDRGTTFLIDDRFGKAQIRELLPRWWATA